MLVRKISAINNLNPNFCRHHNNEYETKFPSKPAVLLLATLSTLAVIGKAEVTNSKNDNDDFYTVKDYSVGQDFYTAKEPLYDIIAAPEIKTEKELDIIKNMNEKELINSIKTGKLQESVLSNDVVLEKVSNYAVKSEPYAFYTDYSETIDNGISLGLFKKENDKIIINQDFSDKIEKIRTENEALRKELSVFLAALYLSKKIDFPEKNNSKNKNGFVLLMVPKQ